MVTRGIFFYTIESFDLVDVCHPFLCSVRLLSLTALDVLHVIEILICHLYAIVKGLAGHFSHNLAREFIKLRWWTDTVLLLNVNWKAVLAEKLVSWTHSRPCVELFHQNSDRSSSDDISFLFFPTSLITQAPVNALEGHSLISKALLPDYLRCQTNFARPASFHECDSHFPVYGDSALFCLIHLLWCDRAQTFELFHRNPELRLTRLFW